MKMSWLAVPASTYDDYKDTFKNVLIVAFINFMLSSIYACTPDYPEEVDGEITMIKGDCVNWQVNLLQWVNFFFWAYTFICLVRLRVAVRKKYNIPEENCHGCEDEICIFCCPCLSAIQIAHQTADYDNEKAYFFTKTGLANEPTSQAILV